MERVIKTHDDETAAAIAAYKGKVTKCKTGTASAPARTSNKSSFNQDDMYRQVKRILSKQKVANDD